MAGCIDEYFAFRPGIIQPLGARQWPNVSRLSTFSLWPVDNLKVSLTDN